MHLPLSMRTACCLLGLYIIVRPSPAAYATEPVQATVAQNTQVLVLANDARCIQQTLVIQTMVADSGRFEGVLNAVHVRVPVPTIVRKGSREIFTQGAKPSISISDGTLQYFRLVDDRGDDVIDGRAVPAGAYIVDVLFSGPPPPTFAILIQASSRRGIRPEDRLMFEPPEASGSRSIEQPASFGVSVQIKCLDSLHVSEITPVDSVQELRRGNYFVRGNGSYSFGLR